MFVLLLLMYPSAGSHSFLVIMQTIQLKCYRVVLLRFHDITHGNLLGIKQFNCTMQQEMMAENRDSAALSLNGSAAVLST